jgi:hypothetical protein
MADFYIFSDYIKYNILYNIMLFLSSRKKDARKNNPTTDYVMGIHISSPPPIPPIPPTHSARSAVLITPVPSTISRQNTSPLLQSPPIIPSPPKYSSLKEAITASSDKPRPMRWGEPIWFLFHTLAEKVREDKFLFIKDKLLDTIHVICTNLPCPICASHAKTYLSGINFKAIQTKTQLKEFLWTFHNSVNKRKNYPLFSREELDEKYKNAVTINIIQYFIGIFSKKSMNVNLIADDLYRARLIGDLKNWFNENIGYFYP